MKRKKKAKKAGNDMTVKSEMTWQIVKQADGSFKWVHIKRGKQ